MTVAAVFTVGGCGAPSFEEMVPALAQPQTEQDQLPTGEGDGNIDVVEAESTRYLGGTQVAKYWVGLDGEEICLVQSLRGTETVGVSCADAEVFGESGVWVRTSSAEVSATGLLVPERFDLADVAVDEDWVRVSDNLAAPAEEGEAQASSG
ncbi:hypothetical protein GTQ99_04780 [Kineococcus sp. T13]|uniref:hypothetical protein n=1 Tax=Kineococcus vitellinus TaxID=2696565 RepID=UPI0014126478|nr:hypothetical protein [Kineococcus vitellinus]NAZ74739.1 hypothetical protein [Kineococcus vitellinus]